MLRLQSHPVPCLENEKAKVLWDIPWHLEKSPRNGANKPEMSVLDKVNKEWFIIEGTICLPGTIPARTLFIRDKYADLRVGAAYAIILENELTEILQDKKVVNKAIEKSQKWIISQNCEIVKRFTS